MERDQPTARLTRLAAEPGWEDRCPSGVTEDWAVTGWRGAGASWPAPGIPSPSPWSSLGPICPSLTGPPLPAASAVVSVLISSCSGCNGASASGFRASVHDAWCWWPISFPCLEYSRLPLIYCRLKSREITLPTRVHLVKAGSWILQPVHPLSPPASFWFG